MTNIDKLLDAFIAELSSSLSGQIYIKPLRRERLREQLRAILEQRDKTQETCSDSSAE